MKIQYKTLDARLQTAPSRGSARAAAIDLRACAFFFGDHRSDLVGSLTIPPGDRIKIGTGIAVDLRSVTLNEDIIPADQADTMMEQCYGFNGYAGFALPRSGLGSIGITLGNTPGLIDDDYHGELILALWNAGKESFEINALDRLAQFVIIPVVRPEYVEVTEFATPTARGENGFGSSGTR